jgi:hypothetical protein
MAGDRDYRRSRSSVAVEAIKSGAVDLIEKPYPAEALPGAVRAALGERDSSARDQERAAIQQRLATLSVEECAVGSAGRGPVQRRNCPRSGTKRARDRNPPCQRHDEDARHKPLAVDPHGPQRRLVNGGRRILDQRERRSNMAGI